MGAEGRERERSREAEERKREMEDECTLAVERARKEDSGCMCGEHR